jgi:hypothetical protein
VFIPLCWLVGSTPRIFSTRGKEISMTSLGVGAVMIAKVEGEKNMVVIENISDSIYSMCTLKKDLKVKDVRTVAKTAKEKDMNIVKATDEGMYIEGGEWWKKVVVRNIHFGEKQQVSLQFLTGGVNTEYSLSHSMLISD